MGLINLTRQTLRSDIVRKAVAGASGTREIKRKEPESGNWFTGLIRNLWGGVTSITGFILGTLGFIGFSFTALWGWLRSTVSFLYNFNWNIPDRQIDAILRQMRIALVGQMGEGAGNFVGFLVCGILPGVVIAKFNKPLGAYVLKEVSEEAFDELMANFRVLLQQTTYSVAAHVFYTWFKSTRRAIKADAANSNSQIGRVGRNIFGESFNKWVQAWGDDNAKPWSFSGAVQEAIESLPDGYIEEFVENFYEGFLEGCDEAGFVVAQSLDRWYAEQRLQKNQILGEETVVEVTPNRQHERERIVLAGARELVKPALVNALTAYQLLDNRDVGQIVGEPAREYIKKQHGEFQIRILFRGVKEPPFGTSQRAQFTLENIRLDRLEWERIKRLAGGVNGYMWGRFRCEGLCSDGSKPTLYASTGEAGTDMIEAFVDELTDLELYKVDPVEEKRTGKRRVHDSLYKPDIRVYPAFVTIFHKTRVLNEEDGRAEMSGVYKHKEYRIPLYTDTKPDDWETTIAEILRQRRNVS